MAGSPRFGWEVTGISPKNQPKMSIRSREINWGNGVLEGILRAKELILKYLYNLSIPSR